MVLTILQYLINLKLRTINYLPESRCVRASLECSVLVGSPYKIIALWVVAHGRFNWIILRIIIEGSRRRTSVTVQKFTISYDEKINFLW